MSSLAIIGTGFAGLGCAHFLHRRFEVTLFEQHDHVGGHLLVAPTPEVEASPDLSTATGLMLYHEATSPLVTRLFTDLRIATRSVPTSLSVRHNELELEYGDGSLGALFSQRKNFFHLRFWKLLQTIRRFHREAPFGLAEPLTSELTLGEYIRQRRYGDDFFWLHLAPLCSALWSSPP